MHTLGERYQEDSSVTLAIRRFTEPSDRFLTELHNLSVQEAAACEKAATTGQFVGIIAAESYLDDPIARPIGSAWATRQTVGKRLERVRGFLSGLPIVPEVQIGRLAVYNPRTEYHGSRLAILDRLLEPFHTPKTENSPVVVHYPRGRFLPHIVDEKLPGFVDYTKRTFSDQGTVRTPHSGQYFYKSVHVPGGQQRFEAESVSEVRDRIKKRTPQLVYRLHEAVK